MIKVCPICGKTFEDKKHPDKKYCCKECVSISQKKGNNLICDYCGKSFYKSPSLIKNNTKQTIFRSERK